MEYLCYLFDKEKRKLNVERAGLFFPFAKGGYFTDLITLREDMGGNDLRGKSRGRPRKAEEAKHKHQSRNSSMTW